MRFRIIVGDKDYNLQQATQDLMEVFKEADALQKITNENPFKITTIDESTWLEILALCKLVNNNFPEVNKVKTSNVHEVIVNAKELADTLNAKTAQQINNLYRAAQYLKMRNLKRCITAVLACRVYIKPTVEDYDKKRAELNISVPITADISRKFKETYPFMN